MLSVNSEGGSTYKFIQVVDRNQFLMAVGLRSQFPCWLLTRGQSLQPLEAMHSPCRPSSDPATTGHVLLTLRVSRCLFGPIFPVLFF